MIQKVLDSTRSSHILASLYDNDFHELVWEKGEVVVRGGSSNRKRNSTNYERTLHEDDGSITKRTRLNTLYSLEQHFPPQRDSDMSSSHQSNGQDHSCQSPQSKNSVKLNEEFANLPRPVKDSKPVITTGNNTKLLQQCLPSSPLPKKQRTDSTKTPTPKVNFSNFSIPAVFLKSTITSTTNYQGNSATQQTKYHSPLESVEEIEARRQIEIKPAKESQGFQKQTSLTVEKSTKPTPPPVDDQNSEAVGYNRGVLGIHRSQGQQQLRCDQTPTSEAIGAKGQVYNNSNMCHEPMLESSSVCSLGASNDPNLGIRKYEDTDDSTYLSDNIGEPEDREGGRVRRSRKAEVHNLSEKKRREKINRKMRTLKELIPNCNKVDNASMLDDAIDYLKTLKLQLQIMSLGSGLWPLMMLPAAHHMNGPHLPQLGMGFRPPHLPIPPLSAITDNTLQMFGFPNQIPAMPMPHAPFFPITGNSATQPHLAEHLINNSAASLNVSLPNNMDMDPHNNIATKLAPSPVSFPHHITSTPIDSPFIFPQK